MFAAILLTALTYPEAERIDQFDVYHEQVVEDPYRWLEDYESSSTKEWIESQKELTIGYLKKIPARKVIKNHLEKIWDYEKWSLPQKAGGRYYWLKNSGLESQFALYVSETLTSSQQCLLDPRTWSEDGTAAISDFAADPTGRYLAYMIRDGGSDCETIYIRDLNSGEDLEERCQWVKFSPITWKRDGSGFFYSSFGPETDLERPNYRHAIYFHAIGSDQSEDQIIYERPDMPELIHSACLSTDGSELIISAGKGCERNNSLSALSLETGQLTPLFTAFDAMYHYLASSEGGYLIFTTKEAPMGRVVRLDKSSGKLSEITPESKHPLYYSTVVGDKLILTHLVDASSSVTIYDQEGNFDRELPLPELCSVGGFNGDSTSSETFYFLMNETTPGEVHHLNLETMEDTRISPRPPLDLDTFVTERHFYPSKDGTLIPLTLSYKKGMKPDSSTKTLLYGYGGFGLTQIHQSSLPMMAWMEMGGAFAIAGIRGGGEYGPPWHEQGMLGSKQNVFDDFIAAAEWLIEEGYTSPNHLGIFGGSNGGLLVGACLNQRPDLFGAAAPAVGVMDMVRFPLFTIGWAWCTDFGSPEDPGDFANLYKYSPYHNIRVDESYPACFITTAQRDDRVVPMHSYKYAAALQHAQSGKEPILIRIESRAGHGSGKSTQQIIEEWADRLAFFMENLR